MGSVLSTTTESLSFLCLCSFPLYRAGGFAFTHLIQRSPQARPLFATSFALSVSLLILILLEVLGVLHARSRSFLWRGLLGFDLVLLVAVLPLVQIDIVLRWAFSLSGAASRRLALPPLLAWLWLFYKIGEPFPLLAAGAWYDTSYLGALQNLCLSRAGVIGVSVTAAMSGHGAVSGPASSISRLLSVVDEDELRAYERRLLQALHAVLQHRSHLRELELEKIEVRSQDDAARRALALRPGLAARVASLTARLVPLLLRSAPFRTAAAEVRRSRREERALRAALRRQLCGVAELLEERERHAASVTLRGQLYNLLGYVFSLYCVFKMWSATRCILWQHGVLGEDPITRWLRIALSRALPALDPI